jgi:squalene cyclase
VSAFTGGDKDKDEPPAAPAAPQRDTALDAQLAQQQQEALAARQAADEAARAERENISRQLAESEAREAERTAKEKAEDERQQRAARAKAIGRPSLLAQGGSEIGIPRQTTFGG